MNDEYTWWFLIVGLCIGGALVWLVRGQLAREEEDVAETERGPESRWISRTIERAGGIAPADLVAQVLALHRSYLHDADPFEAGLDGDAPGEATDDPAAYAPAASPPAAYAPATGGTAAGEPAGDPAAGDPAAGQPGADDDEDAGDDADADVGPDSDAARLIWLERASPADDDTTYPGNGSSPGDRPSIVETGHSRQDPAPGSGTR
jgi:hypothetical protein